LRNEQRLLLLLRIHSANKAKQVSENAPTLRKDSSCLPTYRFQCKQKLMPPTNLFPMTHLLIGETTETPLFFESCVARFNTHEVCLMHVAFIIFVLSQQEQDFVGQWIFVIN